MEEEKGVRRDKEEENLRKKKKWEGERDGGSGRKAKEEGGITLSSRHVQRQVPQILKDNTFHVLLVPADLEGLRQN